LWLIGKTAKMFPLMIRANIYDPKRHRDDRNERHVTSESSSSQPIEAEIVIDSPPLCLRLE
jgi:hypothetical protein